MNAWCIFHFKTAFLAYILLFKADNIQNTLRELGKISDKEVVKKQGDLYVAINVLSNESRILESDYNLIESLNKDNVATNKRILKG